MPRAAHTSLRSKTFLKSFLLKFESPRAADPFPRSKTFSLKVVPQILTNKPAALAMAGYSGHMWELYAVWSSLPSFLQALIN